MSDPKDILGITHFKDLDIEGLCRRVVEKEPGSVEVLHDFLIEQEAIVGIIEAWARTHLKHLESIKGEMSRTERTAAMFRDEDFLSRIEQLFTKGRL